MSKYEGDDFNGPLQEQPGIDEFAKSKYVWPSEKRSLNRTVARDIAIVSVGRQLADISKALIETSRNNDDLEFINSRIQELSFDLRTICSPSFVPPVFKPLLANFLTKDNWEENEVVELPLPQG